MRGVAPKDCQEVFTALVEMFVQAPNDLCGEQRAFYLPRINNLFLFMGQTFPWTLSKAFEEAKDPWGEPVMEGKNE